MRRTPSMIAALATGLLLTACASHAEMPPPSSGTPARDTHAPGEDTHAPGEDTHAPATADDGEDTHAPATADDEGEDAHAPGENTHAPATANDGEDTHAPGEDTHAPATADADDGEDTHAPHAPGEDTHAPATADDGEDTHAPAPAPVDGGEAIVHPPVPSEPRPAGPPPETIRVALYRAPGVGMDAHVATLAVLREAQGYRPSVVTPEQIREGALERFHVVIFTGGRGGVQGRALGEEGRQLVRDFVAAGGGYVGVCAGSYLAMQGPAEFYKLAMVAARNLTGDAWRRGVATLVVRAVGSERTFRLFYANGPVFQPIEHPVLPPVRPLATYVTETALPYHGTHRGEQVGTPAIIATTYGHGRLVLFSPNPVLSAEGEDPVPELMTGAVRWVATPGPVPATLEFADVFR